jgi:hypothetical protein
MMLGAVYVHSLTILRSYDAHARLQTKAPKKPALMLPPHSAPLDLKFSPASFPSDTSAYVALHGSWNRDTPQGYKVVRIPGSYASDGAWSPTAPISSTTGFEDLLWNTDEGRCTQGCFRPVGLQWTMEGKGLYVGSDASGEVFLLRREEGGSSSSPSLPMRIVLPVVLSLSIVAVGLGVGGLWWIRRRKRRAALANLPGSTSSVGLKAGKSANNAAPS